MLFFCPPRDDYRQSAAASVESVTQTDAGQKYDAFFIAENWQPSPQCHRNSRGRKQLLHAAVMPTEQNAIACPAEPPMGPPDYFIKIRAPIDK